MLWDPKEADRIEAVSIMNSSQYMLGWRGQTGLKNTAREGKVVLIP